MSPDHAVAYNSYGTVLYQLNNLEQALACFDKAISIASSYAEAISNRGVALHDLNRFEEALACHEQAIALNPNQADAFNNYGITLEYLQQFEQALTFYQKAININPNFTSAYNNLGNLFKILNQQEQALASFEKAISLTPDFAAAYFNKSLVLLLIGDYQYGWELYEWRLKFEKLYIGQHYDPSRRYLDQDADGKKILLYAEQGYGDTIQFCRYAKLLVDAGAQVILEVPAPLVSVISSLDSTINVITSGADVPEFDYHTSLMSLPLAFKTTVATIPLQMPYLFAHKEKVAVWKERLGQKLKPRIGLVWQGGFRPHQPTTWSINKRRNIDLEMFAEFKDLDVVFYSIQKGQPAESQIQELQSKPWNGPNILDFTAQLHDFSDTAAFIENLDLVISVDTSTAHLAAALGKEVWILNRFDSCWRWLQDKDDSPWYPTVTLFKQSELGNWHSVLADVKDKLLKRYGTTGIHR